MAATVIASALIGTYLMIGAFVAVFCWSCRDKDDWLMDHPVIGGLTCLRIMFVWPTFFVKLGRKMWGRFKDLRSRS